MAVPCPLLQSMGESVPHKSMPGVHSVPRRSMGTSWSVGLGGCKHWLGAFPAFPGSAGCRQEVIGAWSQLAPGPGPRPLPSRLRWPPPGRGLGLAALASSSLAQPDPSQRDSSQQISATRALPATPAGIWRSTVLDRACIRG